MIEKAAKVLTPSVRLAVGALFVLVLLSLLAGAYNIPFIFDSQSIRYKFGMDKIFLRTGKVIGLFAAVLLLIQLLLSARFKVMDKVFALNNLYIFHRINAVTVAVLALLHPLFIFAPEDIKNIPVEIKYWPEILGALLLILIWLLTASGIWRLFLDFSFDRWWIFHRAAAFIAVILLITHILFVSESFESGLPRYLVFGAACIYAVVFGWVKIKPLLLRGKPYTVTSVAKAGNDAYSIEAVPQNNSIFKYIPGQFAFITFKSENISGEEHPFSLSSSPTRNKSLIFTIRCSGDWTAQIGRLREGDSAFIDGPYGRFSHLTVTGQKDLIMIAGGIGITPMLSMLRYMADAGDTRKIILIWSNRTEEDLVYPYEFIELEQRLKGLEIIYIYTRQTSSTSKRKRLDRDTLEKLLTDADRKSAVFICGPPVMMESVHNLIISIGFQRRNIYMENFSL